MRVPDVYSGLFFIERIDMYNHCPHCKKLIDDEVVRESVMKKADIENVHSDLIEDATITCSFCNKPIKILVLRQYVLDKE